jgi:hypothetical protein
MATTPNPTRFLKKGDAVVWNCLDTEFSGVVTRTLGQTHLATRVRTVHVWVETADGESFVGEESLFALADGSVR